MAITHEKGPAGAAGPLNIGTRRRLVDPRPGLAAAEHAAEGATLNAQGVGAFRWRSSNHSAAGAGIEDPSAPLVLARFHVISTCSPFWFGLLVDGVAAEIASALFDADLAFLLLVQPDADRELDATGRCDGGPWGRRWCSRRNRRGATATVAAGGGAAAAGGVAQRFAARAEATVQQPEPSCRSALPAAVAVDGSRRTEAAAAPVLEWGGAAAQRQWPARAQARWSRGRRCDRCGGLLLDRAAGAVVVVVVSFTWSQARRPLLRLLVLS